MRDKEISEGLGDMAHMAEKDHEVQMARADLYKIAKYSIKLHEMLKSVSEAEGLEGWVQSKITKAADYLGSVYHHLDYEQATGELGESVDTCGHCGCEVGNPKPGCDCKEDCHSPVTEARDTHCSDKCCGSDVKAEDCTCPPTCKHCNCNAVQEGKSPHKKGTKKYKKHMAAMHAESLQDRLSAKIAEKKDSPGIAAMKKAGNAKADAEAKDRKASKMAKK